MVFVRIRGQCFGTVVWMTGRASGLEKSRTSNKVLLQQTYEGPGITWSDLRTNWLIK